MFESFGDDVDGILKDLKWRIPMSRPGSSDEGGEMIAFLLSDRASFMTGEVLVSDGGTMNMRVMSDTFAPPGDRMFEPSTARAEACEASV